ncbi:MAG: type I-E CRISPR-associated protein Cse2/CasB [Oscillospiraceae bacterium]|nr:type I-E CRISPR-associated protein Cse2/CasB [Oscillospiraceae bacterium]
MAASTEEIRKLMKLRLSALLHTANAPAQRASLAELRRGLGHAPGELPGLWGAFLEGMPETMYGRSGEPSREEWAIYTALTLFALHQQGREPAAEPMHREGVGFGAAVGMLAEDEDSFERALRRLNAAATAGSVSALERHLRGLVQLLRDAGVPLDYVSLAGDVYSFQFPESVNRVRLRWAQDFYSTYYRQQTREGGTEDEKA